ncbi:MAG: YdeI/OmpD-associated family protein [Actinobacteria bacterium]|nr:YdeI/OmpD-associated family protein [Actinomycetota bacterium]
MCYGWIDGQKRSADDGFWLQRFTPRRARSSWSKINREKVEALIAAVPTAAAFFETLDRLNRYALLYRVQDAKHPETRQRRIAQFVTMLAEQRTLYPEGRQRAELRRAAQGSQRRRQEEGLHD